MGEQEISPQIEGSSGQGAPRGAHSPKMRRFAGPEPLGPQANFFGFSLLPFLMSGAAALACFFAMFSSVMSAR